MSVTSQGFSQFNPVNIFIRARFPIRSPEIFPVARISSRKGVFLMDKVRIGMVGSRFAADFHADSHSRNPKAEIVAVAAIDNLEEYSRKWGIRETLTDYKELCRRKDIDVIDVCVPNFLHYEVVME